MLETSVHYYDRGVWSTSFPETGLLVTNISWKLAVWAAPNSLMKCALKILCRASAARGLVNLGVEMRLGRVLQVTKSQSVPGGCS